MPIMQSSQWIRWMRIRIWIWIFHCFYPCLLLFFHATCALFKFSNFEYVKKQQQRVEQKTRSSIQISVCYIWIGIYGYKSERVEGGRCKWIWKWNGTVARKSFYDNFSRVSSFDQASAWRAEKSHSSMNVNMIFNHTHTHTNTHPAPAHTHRDKRTPSS